MIKKIVVVAAGNIAAYVIVAGGVLLFNKQLTKLMVNRMFEDIIE